MARSNGGNGPIVCDLGRMVPELRVERERSRLVIEELTNLIDGSESFTERRREVERTILQNPVFNQEDRYNLTNDELFTRAVEKLVECAKFNSWDQYEKLQMMRTINEEAGTFIQEYFFKGTIESQGTEEQKAKWVPPAKEYSILGTYAQTELGHGSNIQNLETTATYDPSTQEFILHSPTLTSIKWWPGSLGHTATHAIVVARLIIKGKDHGIHLFIVQLRSLKDHKRLPGIETGDIGPKFGYNGVDNGYLKLTNVRIPRDQMLMKHAQVSPEGVYCKPPTNKKVSYSTMLLMRTGIALDIPCKLARAVTIATRYSVVRRQSQIKKNEPEVQVIDYQTQQFKLLPLLATAYTFSFTSVYMIQMFLEIQMNIAKDNLMSLSEHHATSAGLKAFLTDTCCKGMEVCRLACGGHGYLLASGIPTLYVNCTAAQTYEGENTVLYLEAAKYLHKMFNQRLTQSQLPPNIVYLACDYPKHTSCVAHTPEQFSDHNILLEAYARRARMMVEIAATQYQCTKSSGLNDVEAWNASSVDWTNAAKAHCNFVVLRISIETVQNANVSPANLAILKTLCSLYALYGIVESSGEFALDGYLSTKQIRNGRKYFYSLLKIVRHEAVPLVDAFDIPDAVLNSALGRYDGKVYRDLYERALKAPRNKSEVHEVYYKYLRPMIKSGVAAKL